MIVALAISCVGLLYSPVVFAVIKVGDLECRHVAPILKSYLQRHVNYSTASTNLEKRTVDQFVKKLDSAKLYLLKKDIAKIKSLMTKVFAKTSSKDCAAIEKTQKLVKKRLAERVAFAKQLLGPKFKYNKNTSLFLDPDKRKRPTTKKQAQDFLKRYIQFQISNYLATDEPLEKAKELVIRSYERNQRRMANLKLDDLYAVFIDSFAHALDPHSSYFSRDALKDFEIQMSLSLEGIGASLSSRDGFTVIEQLIAGGAAYKSGKLKPKDKIVAVGQGEKGKFENVIEMDLKEVVKKIRGKKGSLVRLTVTRKSGGTTKRFIVKLVRDKISLEDDAASVTYQTKKMGLKTHKVALITLPSFYADSRGTGRTASKDIKKLLKQVKKEKADAVVFDLSTNGGGSLDDAVRVAGLFFAKGNVVKQSYRDPNRPEVALSDSDATVDYNGPLVILTSPISASASEIVSGTLKEYRRAVIVGSKHTFGKGTVQSVEPLMGGKLGAIKTTVGMFFTAGGKSTQLHGVVSDISFPSIYDSSEIGEKTLDYSLPPKTIKPFLSAEAYVPEGPGAWDMVSRSMIRQLKKQSKKRVAANKDFKKIVEDLNKAKKKQNKKIVLSELMKTREDVKKEQKEKGEDPDKVLTAEEKKEKYLERAEIQEAIGIAFDMADLLKHRKIKMGENRRVKKPASN